MMSFFRNLFQPPEQLLREAVSFLNNLSMVSASGININDYISWVGLLGSAWAHVIDSLLASLAFVGILFLARAIYRFYLAFKEGIQWW